MMYTGLEISQQDGSIRVGQASYAEALPEMSVDACQFDEEGYLLRAPTDVIEDFSGSSFGCRRRRDPTWPSMSAIVVACRAIQIEMP